MADYFTHFSCVLDVGSPEKAIAALDLLTRLHLDEEGADDPEYSGFVLSQQDGPGSSILWFHDDEGEGDIEGVIRFVLCLAEEIDLTGLWGFEYALCRIRHKAYYAGIRIMPYGRASAHTSRGKHIAFGPNHSATDFHFQLIHAQLRGCVTSMKQLRTAAFPPLSAGVRSLERLAV